MKQAIPHRPDSLRDQAINRLLSQRTERELQLAIENKIYKGFFVFLLLVLITSVAGLQ